MNNFRTSLFTHLKLNNINLDRFIITYGTTNPIKVNQIENCNFQWIYFNLCGLDIESQINLEKLSYRFLNSQHNNYLDRIGLVFYNDLTKMTGLPVIVFGLSGNESIDIAQNELHNIDRQFRCIRRFTGGGTVVIDSNCLTLGIIAPHEIYKFKSHKHISNWCYNLLFKPNEIIPEGCELDGDFVIRIGNLYKKFGGNAMGISKNYFIHHSSLLWRFTDSINILNLPSKQPSYRKNRTHYDFLQPLSQCTNLPPNEFLNLMIENFKSNII